jgi:hypothetical protein
MAKKKLTKEGALEKAEQMAYQLIINRLDDYYGDVDILDELFEELIEPIIENILKKELAPRIKKMVNDPELLDTLAKDILKSRLNKII